MSRECCNDAGSKFQKQIQCIKVQRKREKVKLKKRMQKIQQVAYPTSSTSLFEPVSIFSL